MAVRGCACVAVVVAAVAAWACAGEAAEVKTLDSIGELYSLMYVPVGGDPCVRLLDRDREVGCTTSKNGARGVLWLVETASEYDEYVSKCDGEEVVALGSTLFTRATVETLRKKCHISGLVLLDGEAPAQGSSPDSVFPNQQWGLQPTHNTSTVAWNAVGDSMMFRKYDYPMWAVFGNDSTSVRSLAVKNQKGKYPKWAVEISTFMHGAADSETCLRRGMCVPLGGKSVWSTLEPLTGKPVIFTTSTLDSNAMFHDHAKGADAGISGVVTLLAAEIALHNVDTSSFTSDIVFSFLNGEAWGGLGSKKFLHDIQTFKCNEYSATTWGQCVDPFMVSTEFLKINLANVSAVLDVSQVALPTAVQGTPTLFLHQHVDTPATTQLLQKLQAQSSAALQFSPVGVQDWGIPPSPAMSFVQLGIGSGGTGPAAAPVVVLADHQREYRNAYYHSHYDADIDAAETLCAGAGKLARALFELASPLQAPDSLQADCGLVSELWYCLTVNLKCRLFTNLIQNLTVDSAPSHYVGVFGYSPTSYYIGAPVKLVYSVLYNYTASARGQACEDGQKQCPYGYTCIGSKGQRRCLQASVYYHDAISTGFEYDGSWWKLSSDTSAPVWTESNWNGLSLLTYQKDSPVKEGFFLAAGVAELLLSCAAVYALKRLLPKRFKLA
eukprot:TRINITY_DN4364_c0_g1_i1.p1 TRINITY_DN4364_c0_g1~~TRINITY_DN4364_c0_g1_i1.p1  ORF type:complete len:666 (-),score=152.19 TRINITY_DN4364_c0_g1_i1:83-2080(-)